MKKILISLAAAIVALTAGAQEKRMAVVETSTCYMRLQPDYESALETQEEVISAYRLLSAIGKLTPTGLGLSVEQYDPSVYYNDVANKWIGWGIDE